MNTAFEQLRTLSMSFPSGKDLEVRIAETTRQIQERFGVSESHLRYMEEMRPRIDAILSQRFQVPQVIKELLAKKERDEQMSRQFGLRSFPDFSALVRR